MPCKKHPKYQAERYPTSECGNCLEIWNQKKRTRHDVKMVDGGSQRLSYVDIHVGDEGDKKEVHFSDSKRRWTERGPR